ncbi:MAG: sulfite exporter TauE/SafE family protein, partial [Burkholderiales bacterium]
MLEGLSALQIALAACIVLGAFVVRGMSGFGAGMIGIPLLAFLMPVRTAVAMFGLMVLTLFTFLSIRDWREVVRREFALLLVPTILGVVAGVLLFRHLDNRLLLQLLGGFLIAYSLYVLAVHTIGLPMVACSERWAIPVGFAGAFIDTLFGGGGGTLVVIYLHMRGVGRAPFRATVAALWLFEMIARVAGYGAAGYYTMDILLLCALLMPMMFAGSWLGERLGNRISQETFSKLMAALLILT